MRPFRQHDPQGLTPTGQPRHRFRIRSLAWLAVPVLVVACGRPEVGPDAYELVTSLDQVFERRDAEQLDKADSLIAVANAEGKITSEEADLLSGLVRQAESGKWQAARDEARKILAAQSDW